MSYTQVTISASFTSNAGDDTKEAVNKQLARLSATMYAAYQHEQAEGEDEVKAEAELDKGLALFPAFAHDAILESSWSYFVESAVDDADIKSLTNALADFVSIRGDQVSLYCDTERDQDTELWEPILEALLPLMGDAYTKVSAVYYDSKKGVSTNISIAYPDGSYKYLDDILAAV